MAAFIDHRWQIYSFPVMESKQIYRRIIDTSARAVYAATISGKLALEPPSFVILSGNLLQRNNCLAHAANGQRVITTQRGNACLYALRHAYALTATGCRCFRFVHCRIVNLECCYRHSLDRSRNVRDTPISAKTQPIDAVSCVTSITRGSCVGTCAKN